MKLELTRFEDEERKCHIDVNDITEIRTSNSLGYSFVEIKTYDGGAYVVTEGIDDMFEQIYDKGNLDGYYEGCASRDDCSDDECDTPETTNLPKGWFEVVRDKHGKNGVLKRAIKADEVICFTEYDDKTVDVVLKDHIAETTEPYEVLIQKYKKALAEGSE